MGTVFPLISCADNRQTPSRCIRRMRHGLRPTNSHPLFPLDLGAETPPTRSHLYQDRCLTDPRADFVSATQRKPYATAAHGEFGFRKLIHSLSTGYPQSFHNPIKSGIFCSNGDRVCIMIGALVKHSLRTQHTREFTNEFLAPCRCCLSKDANGVP